MDNRISEPLKRLSTDTQAKRTQRLALWEGSIASITSGVQNSFITPFAVLLKATTFQFGLLNAIPTLWLPWAFIATLPLLPEPLRVWLLIPFVLPGKDCSGALL